MDTTTLLIIIIIVLLVGGGGWYGRDAGSSRRPRQWPDRPTVNTASAGFALEPSRITAANIIKLVHADFLVNS